LKKAPSQNRECVVTILFAPPEYSLNISGEFHDNESADHDFAEWAASRCGLALKIGW